jgi:hypothetical protein
MRARTTNITQTPRRGRKAVRHEVSIPVALDARFRKRCASLGCDLSRIACDALLAYLSADPGGNAAKSGAEHTRSGHERTLKRGVELIVLAVCRLDRFLEDIANTRSAARASEIAIVSEAFSQLRSDLIVAARHVAHAADQLAETKSTGEDAQ